MWFDSAKQLQAEFGSDYYRDVLRSDQPHFSDAANSRALTLKETWVWERADGGDTTGPSSTG